MVATTTVRADSIPTITADWRMRHAARKSKLKNNIQVDVPDTLTLSPTNVKINVLAVLWKVDRPIHGTINAVDLYFNVSLFVRLFDADGHLIFRHIS